MEYKGKLKGFPKEVVEKMLERQEEQGNTRDISVFEKYPNANRSTGGFNWDETPETILFWGKVISNRNFKAFYNEYPTLSQKLLNLPLEEKKHILDLLTNNIKEEESVKVGDLVTVGGIIGKVENVNSNCFILVKGVWYPSVTKIDPNKTVKDILG